MSMIDRCFYTSAFWYELVALQCIIELSNDVSTNNMSWCLT